ncbi:MAG TPA: TraR/DksA family transcriptional regulator [Terriglobia bacterium]|nr:TraR/DksA family transcriptional regulator [Terriglobia bacterium]
MDAKQTEATRLRLTREHKTLVKSINRNRIAAEEIQHENTEDEGDLATMSHHKELLYNLHEGDYARLKSIQQALNALDRGQYGECINCGEDIDRKRLDAVPWATLCIVCQELTETEHTSRRIAAGLDEDETYL